MNILFCADTNIQKEVKIDPEIIKLIQEKVDFSVCNLEGFLVKGDADPDSMSISYKHFMEFAKKMKIKYVSLANNHINDNGEKGRKLTIKILEKIGIDYFGTKEKPFLIINEEVALLGSVWKLTGGNQSGLNSFWFNLKEQLNYVKKLVEKYKVIWVPHWGVDMECLPHPWQREAAKQMIEEGVELIYGSHPHLVHHYESINEKLVFYSGATLAMPKNKITYYLPKETGNGILTLFDSKKNSDIEISFSIYNDIQRNFIKIITSKLTDLQRKENYDTFFRKKRNKKKLPVYQKRNFFYNSLLSIYPICLSFLFRFDAVRNIWKKMRRSQL